MAKLTNAEIRSYAANINAAQFPYFCAETGELAESLAYVISATIHDLIHSGILHRWKRSCNWQ